MYNARNVKFYRVYANLKQEQIAEKLGISLTTYNGKENGKRAFTLNEAKMLSDLFGRTIDEIFYEEVRI